MIILKERQIVCWRMVGKMFQWKMWLTRRSQKSKWLKSNASNWRKWRFSTSKCRSKGQISSKLGMSHQRTPCSYLTANKWEILCLSLAIGPKSADICSISAVYTRYHSSCLTSLNRRVSVSWGRRQRRQTRPKHWSRKCESGCSPKWVKSTLITRCSMTRSLRTRRSQKRRLMATYTMKVRSTKYAWKTLNLDTWVRRFARH